MDHPAKIPYKFHFIILCSCFLVPLNSFAPALALTLPETARLLPPETVLLVDIHDFDQLKTQFQETDYYKLYKDPAMKPFFDDLKTEWKQNPEIKKNKTIELFTGAGGLPDGRIALAVVLDEKFKDAKNPPFLLIIQWEQNINHIKETANKIIKKAVEDGHHQKNENYRGVDITTIIRKSSETYNICFIEDYLVAAVDMDVLKFVIAHIKGADSPTLSDDSNYSETIRAIKLQNVEQINCFVNIKQLIKTAISTDTKDKTKKMIDNLGVDNVVSFGVSLSPTAAQKTPTGPPLGKVFLKINGPRKRITKMLELEPASLKMPRFIPDSAYAVSSINLNIKNAFNELSNILNNFSPQFAAMMYMPLIPASPQGEPPVQIKEGIIDHLGSQIIIAQNINEYVPITGIEEPQTSLIAIAIQNRPALEKSLSSLHGKIFAANNPNASRQLLGHTIYSIDISSLLPGLISSPKMPMQNPAAQDMPEMPKFAFTFTDTHLIFSQESVVEKAIRTLNSTENTSMDSARWFNFAKSAIPSLTGMVTLQNDRASGKYIWSQMRDTTQNTTNKDSDANFEMGAGIRHGSSLPEVMFSQAGIRLLDFSLLPEFDAIEKYFGLSTFYGISRPDGFFFEFKELNPPDID
ncbi:MAG: DUF3352 domain-containing protein [Sedimentisphaerales bacterium]|nr:DUF3352 domain-containing protein [Sedimentisphaerales bacterium]